MPECVGHVPKICNFRLVVYNQGAFPLEQCYVICGRATKKYF